MTFTAVAQGIWITERPQKFWGVECGTRTTIVALSGGGLFVHCPVALDPATRREVDALGEVRAVVASSLFHHLYVGDWMRAYPKALFACCPGLEHKRSDLPFSHVLGDVPHPLWAPDLEQIFFSARFEKEVVFFHRKTRTMVSADAMLNLADHPSLRTRLVARYFMRNVGPGLGWMEHYAVRDWRLGRRQVDRILAWEPEQVLIAHGKLVTHDGAAVIRDAYAFLPPGPAGAVPR